MKKGRLFLPVLLIILFFQTNLIVNAQSSKGGANSVKEFHIILAPNEKRESIEVAESCLILLRDYTTFITLPFGKQFEWKILAGTKFKVSPGKYDLENKSSSSLEFKLVSVEQCAE